MFPHENPINEPGFLTTPPYETLLSDVKQNIINYFIAHYPEESADIAITLENKAELLTKFTEALTAHLQSHFRQINEQAKQMFGMYATENDMVDLIVSQLDITRQVISHGDENAFPPIVPVMESNHNLLTRYYLAAYALASTGTRGGYRFHAMTLGGRPSINTESPEAGKIVVTYQFKENSFSGKTKDALARQVARGEVDCFILSHEGDGTAPEDLINATQTYLTSEDIGQETDLVRVKSASITRWSFAATLYVRSGLDEATVKQLAVDATQKYADEKHRLQGKVERSMLDHYLLRETGGHRLDITQPATSIRCAYSEAPYCEGININIVVEPN